MGTERRGEAEGKQGVCSSVAPRLLVASVCREKVFYRESGPKSETRSGEDETRNGEQRVKEGAPRWIADVSGRCARTLSRDDK